MLRNVSCLDAIIHFDVQRIRLARKRNRKLIDRIRASNQMNLITDDDTVHGI
jgi:hypothetical protein